MGNKQCNSPAHSFETTVIGGLRSLALCQEEEPYLTNDRQFKSSIKSPESWSCSVMTYEHLKSKQMLTGVGEYSLGMACQQQQKNQVEH